MMELEEKYRQYVIARMFLYSFYPQLKHRLFHFYPPYSTTSYAFPLKEMLF